jgi:hypothetical protein
MEGWQPSWTRCIDNLRRENYRPRIGEKKIEKGRKGKNDNLISFSFSPFSFSPDKFE